MTRFRLLTTFGVWLALVVSLQLADARPAPLVLAAIIVVGAAVLFVSLDVSESVQQVQWTRTSPRYDLQRGDDPRVRSLLHQLYGTQWLGATAISNTLVAVIDDRLVRHHHIDRAVDPAAAAAVLTPRLRRLVDGPPRPSVMLRDLDQIVADIEQL